MMISSVGIRPRSMRSCVARLKGRAPECSSSTGASSTSPVTPFSSASTSSCERKLSAMDGVFLLDHERGEQDVVHLLRFAVGVERQLHLRQDFLRQLFLVVRRDQLV